jgi:hypothetical protein
VKTHEHYSEGRANVLNEAFNGLLLLNGGGVTVLLGFLQANWKETPPELKRLVLVGIAGMVVGLIFAVPIPLLRYRHSHLWEKEVAARRQGKEGVVTGLERSRRKYWVGYLVCYLGSMAWFVLGAVFIVCAAFRFT